MGPAREPRLTSAPEGAPWLTWPQAAELVGCPVPTIETYVRTVRIEKRTARPSLKRESVEDFARWWREETARRQRAKAERPSREARRIEPPEPEGWIQTREAATRLGHADADHIVWLVRQGKLEGRKVGVRWWAREAQVDEYAQERDKWVSHVKAAELVGCSHETIRRAVNAGLIEKRDVHHTQASLSLESVLNFRGARQA